MFKKWYVWLVIVIAVLGGSAYGIHSHNEQVKADKVAAIKAKEKRFDAAKDKFIETERKMYNVDINLDNDLEDSWKKLITDDSVEYEGTTYSDIDSLSDEINSHYADKSNLSNLSTLTRKYGKELTSNVTKKNNDTLSDLKKLSADISAYAEIITNPTGSYIQVTDKTDEYYHKINNEFNILE